MGQCAKRDTFEKDCLKATMTKITRFFSCTLLEEIYRGYMMIWKDFTYMLTVFEELQFIFRKDVYFGFLAYYEILTPLNLRALWTVFKVCNFLTLMKSVGIHIQRGYQFYICYSKLKYRENCTNIRTMEILRVVTKRDTFCKKCPVLWPRIDILFFNLLQLLMHSRTWEWFLTSLHWSYL